MWKIKFEVKILGLLEVLRPNTILQTGLGPWPVNDALSLLTLSSLPCHSGPQTPNPRVQAPFTQPQRATHLAFFGLRVMHPVAHSVLGRTEQDKAHTNPRSRPRATTSSRAGIHMVTQGYMWAWSLGLQDSSPCGEDRGQRTGKAKVS